MPRRSKILDDLIQRLGPRPRRDQVVVYFETVHPCSSSSPWLQDTGSRPGTGDDGGDDAAVAAHVDDRVFITQSTGAVVTGTDGLGAAAGISSSTRSPTRVAAPQMASSADFSQAAGRRRLGTTTKHKGLLPPLGTGGQQQQQQSCDGGPDALDAAALDAAGAAQQQHLRAARVSAPVGTSSGTSLQHHSRTCHPHRASQQQSKKPPGGSSGGGALVPSYSELYTQIRETRGRLLVHTSNGSGAGTLPSMPAAAAPAGLALSRRSAAEDDMLAGWCCSPPMTSSRSARQNVSASSSLRVAQLLAAAGPGSSTAANSMLLMSSARGHLKASTER